MDTNGSNDIQGYRNEIKALKKVLVIYRGLQGCVHDLRQLMQFSFLFFHFTSYLSMSGLDPRMDFQHFRAGDHGVHPMGAPGSN